MLNTCKKCGCITSAHHGKRIGCEGAGGNCGCEEEFESFDLRNEPTLTITDLYHRPSGRHLRSTMSTEDGTIIEESGPCSSKDVVFLPAYKREAWDRFLESE